jgi:hypothetical protein
MKTYEYLIVRHGSNAANQSMCQRLPVAIVRAASAAQAKSFAEATGSEHATKEQYSAAVAAVVASAEWSDGYGILPSAPSIRLYANQYLEAIPRSRARVSEWNQVCEDAERAERAAE